MIRLYGQEQIYQIKMENIWQQQGENKNKRNSLSIQQSCCLRGKKISSQQLAVLLAIT